MDRTLKLDGDLFDLEILADYFHSPRTTVEKSKTNISCGLRENFGPEMTTRIGAPQKMNSAR
jgi:hypothetical protein